MHCLKYDLSVSKINQAGETDILYTASKLKGRYHNTHV